MKVQSRYTGNSITIDNTEQIDSILKQLDLILFGEDLGTTGYAFSGYVNDGMKMTSVRREEFEHFAADRN